MLQTTATPSMLRDTHLFIHWPLRPPIVEGIYAVRIRSDRTTQNSSDTTDIPFEVVLTAP